MVAPTEEEKISIINCLQELDCCSRCILRLLGIKSCNTAYMKSEQYLDDICNRDPNKISDTVPKKFKKNPCRVCLDILQEATLERFTDNIPLTNVKEYQYSDYLTYVSLPKSVLIRCHSILVYLISKFPGVYSHKSADLENMNKVFKLASSEIISRKCNKMFNPNSNFIFIFEIDYGEDDTEVQNLTKLNHLITKGNQRDLSRNFIVDILNKYDDDDLFRSHFPVPPNIPNKETVARVHCKAESIWVGGRYLKFSRDMGQTPWIINGKVMAQYCLQDIIFDSIEKILGCDKQKLTFCSSGREDADVRMIGKGRPFYIQIDDPRDSRITFDLFRDIENEIFKSKLAAVIKLQAMSKHDLKRIKEGEQHKRKHYYALCQMENSDVTDAINKINIYNNRTVEILQRTPMRVLHRRTQSVRKKCIYSMTASAVPGHSNLFGVKLVTQAGTYVKEFVNGDFERTQPSLSTILQVRVDVVALDVTEIELAWPEEQVISMEVAVPREGKLPA